MSARVHCDACEALCCRLIVSVFAEDRIAAHLTEQLPTGGTVMRRDADGWCVALDAHMRCGIYASRPGICRRFVMGGGACREVRAQPPSPVPLVLVPA